MRPLIAAALVAALTGVASAGPIVVDTTKSDDPEAGLIVATCHGITLQGSTFGELSHCLTAPSGGSSVVRFDLADTLLDASHTPLIPWKSRGLLLCVTTAEPAHPFSGNPGIEPRPTDNPPPGEPVELLWLVVFGSLIVGGIVAVQRRLSARSG